MMMLSEFTLKKIRHLLLAVTGALLTITAIAGPDVPPTATITKTPNPNTLVEGALLAPVSVVATGTSPFRYAWKRNGVLLPNDTTNAINRLFVSMNDAGTYTCVVSNAAGSAESNGYVLNVTPATGAPLPTPLTNKTFAEGANMTISVTFSGTNPKASSWQWYKDGVAIPGTAGNEQSGNTLTAYTVNNVSLSVAGNYYCVLRNSQGTTTTNTMTVTINAAIAPPSLGLNGNPVDKIIYQGDKLLLSANLNNASSIKWQKNGVDIPGTNSTTFIINSVALADSGAYTCVGSNSTGVSYTTTAAKVTVLPAAPPAIEVNLPDSLLIDEATTFSLGVYVRGTVNYEWRKNGIAQTQTLRYTLSQPATLADSGYYSCYVSNIYGGTLSTICKIIIVRQPVPLFANLLSSYPAGAGQVRLFMKGVDAEKYTNFFVDKVPVVVSSDGKYYLQLSLAKGLHEVKAATSDGKSEVVKMVMIR